MSVFPDCVSGIEPPSKTAQNAKIAQDCNQC
jgi:hypothetical protein